MVREIQNMKARQTMTEVNLDNSSTMEAFLELPFKAFNEFSGLGRGSGDMFRFYYPNGYGASVVRHGSSYGAQYGLFELAVLKVDSEGDYTLDYTSGITNDVIPSLEKEEVLELLIQIENLPPV